MALEVAPAASMAIRMFCQYCSVWACVIGAAAVSGANSCCAAAPAQRFDPFVEHKLVLDKTTRQAAAEVDLPLIYQAPQPKRQGFLVAGKGALVGGNPGDFMLRNHTARDRLQKDFPDCHESHVTTSLHAAAPGLAAWLTRARGLAWAGDWLEHASPCRSVGV